MRCPDDDFPHPISAHAIVPGEVSGRGGPLVLQRTVEHAETFDAPARAVWKLLIDWEGIAGWMPAGHIRSLEMEGEGLGAVRHLVTGQGARVAERLDAADEEAGILELTIVEPLPWGMLAYSARGRLEALGDDRCRLTWRGKFTVPDSGPEPETLSRFLLQAYRAMFDGIRQASRGEP
jgi:hypothetical protein